MDQAWWVIPVFLLYFLWWSVGMERRMHKMEQSLSALLRHFNIDPLAFAPPSDRVKELAADPARKIEAMRVYRQETGADLKAAKSMIDSLATRG